MIKFLELNERAYAVVKVFVLVVVVLAAYVVWQRIEAGADTPLFEESELLRAPIESEWSGLPVEPEEEHPLIPTYEFREDDVPFSETMDDEEPYEDFGS